MSMVSIIPLIDEDDAYMIVSRKIGSALCANVDPVFEAARAAQPTRDDGLWDHAALLHFLEAEQSKSKRGRNRLTVFDLIWLEALAIIHDEGVPETQAELIKRLWKWCRDNGHAEPSETAMKDRVSAIYKRLGH